MKKISRIFWAAAGFAVAASASNVALAQDMTQELRVNGFTLSGMACPVRSSTVVTVANATTDRPTINIRFGPNPADGAAAPTAPADPTAVPAITTFQVQGADARAACSVALDVSVDGLRKAEVRVISATGKVTFVNPMDQAQLSVIGRFRVNDVQSASKTGRVTAIDTMGPSFVQGDSNGTFSLTAINAQAELMQNNPGSIGVMIQLQTVGGAAETQMKLDQLTGTLSLLPDVSG